MNRWKENWEIKLFAVLLAGLLWLTLRLSHSVPAPVSSRSEKGQHG